jgi:NADPH:quinone reductase-like Zn-dependent oxidoreductase
MRAVWLTGHGGPDSFQVRESPDPAPTAGQVRVRVHAAGVNFAELMASQGLYPDAPPTPCILGYEAAGVIDAVGEGESQDLIGRRVMVFREFGTHSELVCVDSRQTFPMPDAMTFEEGAALPVNYLTAYHMLFHVGALRAGESVLVHMAAGGVGIAALQLCRTVQNVVTFGTASAAKHDVIRAHGCTCPIDYRTKDYVAEVKALSQGAGVDISLNALGGDTLRKDYGLLKPAGRLIAFGFANLVSGPKRNMLRVLGQLRSVPKFDVMKMMSQNRAVAGVNTLHILKKNPGLMLGELQAVIKLYDGGAIKPIIDQVVPFAKAPDAFRRLQEGKNVGKVLLAP